MIRAGDILLFRSPWWCRWLMTYYHAGVAYVVGERVSVIDASWRGVKLQRLRGHGVAVRPKGATEQAGFIAAGWAMSQVGGAYNYRQAFEILLRAFKELLKGEQLARALSYACSPLSVQSWRQADVRFTNAPEGRESPDDIARGNVVIVGEFGGGT